MARDSTGKPQRVRSDDPEVTIIFCAGFPVTLVVIIPAIIGLLMGLKCVKDI